MGEEGLSNRLKVTYVPTPDDYVTYFDYLRRTQRPKAWMAMGILAAIFGAAAGYELAQNPRAGSDAQTALGVFLVCFVVFLVGLVATVFDRSHGRRAARERFKVHKFATYFFLPKTFEASKDGVKLSDEMSIASSQWSGIEKIDATDKAIYVNGAPFNIVVPAHAFPSEAKFIEGTNQLKAWLEAHDRATVRQSAAT
jgi:hypothetical protein